MKKYSKVFKNRQVLTSGEMNDIIEVINDIIGSFNEEKGEDTYFRLSATPESIFKGDYNTEVIVSVSPIDISIDLSKVKIFWDKDGFKEQLNTPGQTYIRKEISSTTTFRATLSGVTETGGSITRMVTVPALSPSYFVQGKSLSDAVGRINQADSYKVKDFSEIENGIRFFTTGGSDIYFFISPEIEFNKNNVYLGSIQFPMERLVEKQNIGGVDYDVYKSSGGDFGFVYESEIVLEIID